MHNIYTVQTIHVHVVVDEECTVYIAGDSFVKMVCEKTHTKSAHCYCCMLIVLLVALSKFVKFSPLKNFWPYSKCVVSTVLGCM